MRKYYIFSLTGNNAYYLYEFDSIVIGIVFLLRGRRFRSLYSLQNYITNTWENYLFRPIIKKKIERPFKPIFRNSRIENPYFETSKDQIDPFL